MAFFSTHVVAGDGKGVAVRVGDDTVMGRVAGLASKLDHEPTPISVELGKFVKTITYVALTIGAFSSIV